MHEQSGKRRGNQVTETSPGDQFAAIRFARSLAELAVRSGTLCALVVAGSSLLFGASGPSGFQLVEVHAAAAMHVMHAPNASKSEANLSRIPEQAEDYVLPAEPTAIVLSLEYGGGLPIPQPQDFKPTPYVRVQADGTVITGGSSPRASVVEMKLAPAELQKLLQEIIAEDQLLQLKPGEIDEAIKATGERIMVADAPTTTLTVKLADREVRLRQYASRMVKSQFPQVESLQRFVRSENRLQRLHSIALLGGTEALGEMLAAVNEAIGAKSAEWPPMDRDSLQSVQREPDGKLFATWERAGVIAGQEKRFTVWVEVDPQGRRKIEVSELRDRSP